MNWLRHKIGFAPLAKQSRDAARPKGFTLIELLMVILIMSIVSYMTASFLKGSSDFERWDETRQKMDALRTAILGEAAGLPDLERNRFGYFGDMGRLPTNLTLLTAAETPAWAFQGSNGAGAGWRGPYLNRKFVGSYAMELDAWGRPFIYSTTALTSFGSDNLAGGTSHASDLLVSFPASERLASVQGRLTDHGTPLGTLPVLLWYASSGTLISSTALSAADGTFSFTTVPFGLRAISVTSLTPPLGPVPVTVDRPTVVLSPNQLEFFGRSSLSLNSVAANGQPMLVLTADSNSSNGNSDTIAMAYTVPTNAGLSPLLIVAVGADDKSSDILPNSADYDGEEMYLAASGVSSASGNITGHALYALMVTAGRTGTITGRFQGTLKPRIITAYTLTQARGPVPEKTTVAVSSTGNVLGSITPLTAGAMIVTAMQQGSTNTMTPSGLNHVEDVEEIRNGNGSVLGHLLTTSLQVLNTVGWTSATPKRMVLLLASYPPLPTPVTGTVRSTYQTSRQLQFLTVRWNGPELLTGVTFNGLTQDMSNVPSGTRVSINQPLTLPASSAATGFSLSFSATMTGREMNATFDWAGGDRDTIQFTVP